MKKEIKINKIKIKNKNKFIIDSFWIFGYVELRDHVVHPYKIWKHITKIILGS